MYRIGKISSDKPGPVMIQLTLTWRKYEIFRNKNNFPENIYVTEDFPKEVLIKRKELLLQKKEIEKNGKVAFIHYDKLIVKDRKTPSDDNKRKRSPSKSPSQATQKEAPRKVNKTNAFNVLQHGKTSTSKPNQ